MSMVDHATSAKVPYAPDDVFEALKHCCKYIGGINIDSIDDVLKTIYLKAGVSLFSWGENVTVTVKSSDDGESIVEITSAPKTGVMFGGAADMGKNKKNMKNIMDALSKDLKKYSMVEKKSQASPNLSIADEIKKYAELKEQGLLTEEEFQAKKKQLLRL